MRGAWMSSIPAAALCALSAGCGGFGQVNQGQVIEYDRHGGRIRLIGDSNYRNPSDPRYDVLPPAQISVPEDPREMGPSPEAGKLLRIDYRKAEAVVFDEAAGTLRTIPFTLLSERTGVGLAEGRAGSPVVDRGAGTVTVYDPLARKLAVLSVAPEHLSLPVECWKAGDQIRYYYKDPARALRLMNVSRTDVAKSGK